MIFYYFSLPLTRRKTNCTVILHTQFQYGPSVPSLFCEVLVKQRLCLVKEGEKAGTKEQAKEAAHIAHQVKEVKDPHLCLHWEGPGCQIQDKGLVHTFNKTRVFFNNEGHRFILLSEENCEANCVENTYNYTMYEHMK